MAEEDQKGIRETVRRKSDRFLFELFRKIESTRRVKEGLRELLVGLEELGYLYPRVYRYDIKGNKYVLVDSLNLPPEDFVPEKTSFEVSNPIIQELEEIIKTGGGKIYVREDIQADLIEGENDPLYYIKQKAEGKKLGIVGIPYVGFSEIYNGGEIRGIIVADYDPNQIVINEREKGMLEKVGIVVGLNVVRQLEVKRFIKQAKLDGETGFYTKPTFHTDLESYIKEINKEDKTYYLMMMDLDNFKEINDLFGHPKGDKVIREVGGFLRSLGPEEVISLYRAGGDEFGVVAKLERKEEAWDLARKIKEGIKKVPVPEGGRYLTVSVGIVGAKKNDFKNGEEWYDKVDKALYNAKSSRDTVVFYE